MNTDIRISVTFLQNPKIKKLERRVGLEGLKALLALWIWTAQNKPTGDLCGLDNEAVEMVADWTGDEGAFISALKALRLLDGEEGFYQIHDWGEHNGWAATEGDRSETGRFNHMKKSYPEIHEKLVAAGLTRITKKDYEALRDSSARQAVVARLLKQAGSEAEATPTPGQADSEQIPSSTEALLKQCLEHASSTLKGSVKGASVAPTSPSPTPAPTPTPSPLDTHKEACAPRPYSPEDIEEAKDSIRREAGAEREEFEQLREAYKPVRDDGPMAGWPEYQQARRSKGWPGLLFVLDRLQTLIEQDAQWKRGYREGLRRFLTDRMWEMEPRKDALRPGQDPEPTDEDRAVQERIERMRAEMKAKEAERKAKAKAMANAAMAGRR